MSLLSLAQLRTEITAAQATDTLIELLQDMGFETTSWHDGSVQRTLLTMCAAGYAFFSKGVPTIANGCFNALSSGTALEEFSDSQYDNQRVRASAARYTLVLDGAAVGPPYTITVSALVATDGTYTYRNTSGGTLSASSSLSLTFECETAGAAGTVLASTIDTLQTPLDGVSIDTASGVLLASGQDQETEPALRLRNTTKWASLSWESTADAYVQMAVTAVANLRVDVDDQNPRGAGTIDIYIASNTGQASAGNVTTVNDYLDTHTFGGGHITYAADTNTQNFDFQVWYTAGAVAADVKTAVEAAITAVLNAAPIGGTDYGSGLDDVILYDDLVAAVRAVENVEAVSFTTPSANITVPAHEIYEAGSFPAVGNYHEATA